MEYRKEIDGLRAIAVLPVIFYHAGFKVFQGGFIGVDVFFVISGYLITNIILSDMNKGKFSIVTFYERRARRILPALFLVMLCCIPFAWLWLTPNHLKDFSQSLTAVSIFSSNIFFWLGSGYFDTASELKPLLHTWSLAVEEQYYLFFPLFLMMLWRLRKRCIFGALMFVGLISLMLAQWGAYNKPSGTFYLLPTRAWELAIGALIAFYFLYRSDQATFIRSYKKLSEIFGLLGFLLICYATFAFNKATPFPSLYALIPTVGTGLIIIFSSSETVVGRFLGIKPMVGIGLISYSAYLWHQPLFVFARYKKLSEPGVVLLLILSFSSLLLAYLSWRYVEKPFRDKELIGKSKIFVFAVLGSLFFITIGVVGHTTDGFAGKLEKTQLDILDHTHYKRDKYSREGVCFLHPDQGYEQFSRQCYEITTDKKIMIWGDSHAASLYYGLTSQYEEAIQITASGCPPIIGADPAKRKSCKDISYFAEKIINDYKPYIVFMHANWKLYMEWTGHDHNLLILELNQTIQKVKSISPNTKIVLIGGVPQWGLGLPQQLLSRKTLNDLNVYNRAKYLQLDGGIYKAIVDIDSTLAKVSEQNSINFISPINLMCVNDECPAILSESPSIVLTAWDYGHLTAEGSVFLAKKIADTIDKSDKK